MSSTWFSTNGASRARTSEPFACRFIRDCVAPPSIVTTPAGVSSAAEHGRLPPGAVTSRHASSIVCGVTWSDIAY